MAEMNEESEIVREFRERDAWGLCTCIDLKGCDPCGDPRCRANSAVCD